jgi:hypothetical protein
MLHAPNSVTRGVLHRRRSQTADARGVALPADWQPRDDVTVAPPTTTPAAKERVRDEFLEVTDSSCAKKNVQPPSMRMLAAR